MPIPAQYAHRYFYHFSHIDNLPGLLQNGFLATNHALFPKKHRSIASAGIQARRAAMAVQCAPGGCVHDYVPFYFGSCSPMLLSVINAKNVDQYEILYFEFPIGLLDGANAVFTNASANTVVPPQFYSDPAQLDQLNWSAIDSLKWKKESDDHHHRRMAEVLIHGRVPVTAAARCVVWNQEMRKRVEETAHGRPFPPIEFESRDRRHWFKDFANNSQSSAVTGPREIAFIYASACDYVVKNAGKAAAAPFKNITALRDMLRQDFGCLPQTAELVGLRSANGIHKHTVDVHTLDVVQRLLGLPEYLALDERPKKLVELAAYLHDIGKGPRSRWAANGGLQRVDPNHPVGAMPMMADILTEKVGVIKPATAKTLLKLVCYHDLVGDVLGRNRDESQIVDVVDDRDELDMLFALGKADAMSLVEHWWNQTAADKLYAQCLSAL